MSKPKEVFYILGNQKYVIGNSIAKKGCVNLLNVNTGTIKYDVKKINLLISKTKVLNHTRRTITKDTNGFVYHKERS